MKGATKEEIERLGLTIISIHAPMKGATDYCFRQSGLYRISIHAPMKGATAKCTKNFIIVIHLVFIYA